MLRHRVAERGITASGKKVYKPEVISDTAPVRQPLARRPATDDFNKAERFILRRNVAVTQKSASSGKLMQIPPIIVK